MSLAVLVEPGFFKPLSLLLLLSAVFFASDLSAQDRPGAGPDGTISREAMWPAPTAEDWSKPCLITWQRSWEDAQAVSRETKKPILVCVNMDGEIASEHYAGIRYRDPEIAKLYEPYVCVIASVYRHTPRDYDEEGNRILCPRFGSVTCGEHISIEPGLFKEFFDDKRIAPRHIGVELNGEETYDVYYAFDTESVFNRIREGIEDRDIVPATVARGDRTILERVASRDIQDRVAVEKAYQEGDRTLRRSLLEAAIDHPEAAQVDLLRLAVFGFDVELGQLARQALAKSDTEDAFKLITEALRVPMETGERDSLIDALGRIGKTSPKARMHAVVHKGLAARSALIDVEAWIKSFVPAESWNVSIDPVRVDSRLDDQERILASEDPLAHLELAEAFLDAAYEQPESEKKLAGYLFRDARQTALQAQKLGATGWRVHTVLGLAAYYLDDVETAFEHAEAAITGMPPGTPGWKALAALELFAEARWRSIVTAVREKTDWATWSEAFEGTGNWLTDVHAVYSVLDKHPLGTDTHVVAHYDFLNVLGAVGQASKVLDEGLVRYSDSWRLHDRLRGRILREKGIDGLESVYEAMLREEDASPDLAWFAGYASLVAAEFQRRLGREGEALAAYQRAIDRYEQGISSDPESRDTADHYIALAYAGRARLAFERQDHETAVAELLASFERKPEAAATLDGLNISPVDTAKMLLQRLKDLQKTGLAQKLETALGKLDPELLRLPAYEGDGPSGPSEERRPPWRRAGRRSR
ncbi:MAG: hypothetical protein KJ645_08130 [Planctomycetes bacterium]|nr:hypothetical protein [Planctomycetota bacterium]